MLEHGTVLAGYRIDRLLGKGGMGVVYEATQLSLDRTVALKVLAPELSDDRAFRARFRREGRIQARIEHPHIITVHEAGETEHGLFLAMRLVRGPTLKDMILARELDAGRTLRILAPVAEALDTAHAAGLIHRDVKPQNVLVGTRDHAYLADFGLTRAAGDTNVTEAGQFVGTFDYISPEQIQGQEATALSDVYAFGGMLYEALTGVVPFPGRSRAAVLYAHMASPPPLLSDQRPELPNALDAVITRAMAKDPGARHASASEVVAHAHHALGRKVSAAMSVPGPIAVPEEAGIRRAEAQVSTDEGAVRRSGPARLERTTSSMDTPGVRSARGRAALIASAAVLPVAIAGGVLAGGSGTPAATSGGKSAVQGSSGRNASAKAAESQYAAVVSRAVGALNAKRATGMASLAHARTHAAQAQAAGYVARAYSSAGRSLSTSSPPASAVAENRRLTAAFGAAARAWTSLANAARSSSSGRYSPARAAVKRAEARAAAALAALP